MCTIKDLFFIISVENTASKGLNEPVNEGLWKE